MMNAVIKMLTESTMIIASENIQHGRFGGYFPSACQGRISAEDVVAAFWLARVRDT